MKRCSYCGAEYPDDAAMCAIDHTSLESSKPAPAPVKPKQKVLKEVQPAPIPEAENIPKPEDFRCLWRIDAFDADRLLKQFADAGIRFRIEQIVSQPSIIDQRPPILKVDVHVHWDDEEKAMKIIGADWKVRARLGIYAQPGTN